MRLLTIILTLFLSSCYLANGSPSSANYWVKNGKEISSKEIKKCEMEIYSSLGSYFIYLHQKDENNELFSSKEHQDYYNYFVNTRNEISNCFYNLGYRFKAPLYWCLAQDGDNTKICMENMKYRN